MFTIDLWLNAALAEATALAKDMLARFEKLPLPDHGALIGLSDGSLYPHAKNSVNDQASLSRFYTGIPSCSSWVTTIGW